MHEYIEIQFRRNDKPFRIARQIAHGFEFQEADPPTRTIDIGFAPADEGTRYRLQRIRQIKDWTSQQFELIVSVEDGSLVLRGIDRYSLPEGWYSITANVSGAKLKKIDQRRVEVVHDSHGVVKIDLALDERTIEVDLGTADPAILRLLDASMLDGQAGSDWVQDPGIRPTRRACALNLLASLRVTPSKATPLLGEVECLFLGSDERCYARVTPALYARVFELSEAHDKFYPEGHPHAKIHEELFPAIAAFERAAAGLFARDGLWSFRAEGGPSLQMVIARPTSSYPAEFADIDLDLGNPLQDVAGFIVHIGELLNGKPTNHLDLWDTLRKDSKATSPYIYYKVRKPPKP